MQAWRRWNRERPDIGHLRSIFRDLVHSKAGMEGIAFDTSGNFSFKNCRKNCPKVIEGLADNRCRERFCARSALSVAKTEFRRYQLVTQLSQGD
jgi:hypothetical protein